MILGLLFKVIAVLLGIIVIAKTYLEYKKKQESLIMLVFWVIAWLVIIILAVDPSLIDVIIKMTGTRKVGIGTFLGTFSIFLFFVTYRVYTKANRLEKKIKEITTRLALDDLKEK